MKELVCLTIFIILSTVFALTMIAAGFLCQYKQDSKLKKSTYECGVKPFGDARIKFDIRYFNYAVLFLIFDIETIMLYPFAISLNSLGIFAVIETFIFVSKIKLPSTAKLSPRF